MAEIAAEVSISPRGRSAGERSGSADQGPDQGLPRARQAARNAIVAVQTVMPPDAAEDGVMPQVTVGDENGSAIDIHYGLGPSVANQPMRLRVEVVGGPVAPADLDYTSEQTRHISRRSPCAVYCGRIRLRAESHDGSNATADAVLVVDRVVICAGAIAATTREAVELLAGRLHRRMAALRTRDDAPSS
jgi:hypothetical protein